MRDIYNFLVSLDNFQFTESSIYSIGDFYYFKCDCKESISFDSKHRDEELVKILKSILKKRVSKIAVTSDCINYTQLVGKTNKEVEYSLPVYLIPGLTHPYFKTISLLNQNASTTTFYSLEDLQDLYEESMESIYTIKKVFIDNVNINSIFIQKIIKLLTKLEVDGVYTSVEDNLFHVSIPDTIYPIKGSSYCLCKV